MITEEENDKNFKKCMELIEKWGEQNKPPTLRELLLERAYSKNSVRPDFAGVDEILKIVEKWLPPSHSTNGYEWEKCLKLMREKLR
jgi:hypothetical protein